MIEYQGETYLNVNELAARFHVSRATCYNNLLPHVPKCYLPGRKHALYRQSDVDRFAEVRVVAQVPSKTFPTSPLTAEVGNGSTSNSNFLQTDLDWHDQYTLPASLMQPEREVLS